MVLSSDFKIIKSTQLQRYGEYAALIELAVLSWLVLAVSVWSGTIDLL